jgi:hypothetical protein
VTGPHPLQRDALASVDPADAAICKKKKLSRCAVILELNLLRGRQERCKIEYAAYSGMGPASGVTTDWAGSQCTVYCSGPKQRTVGRGRDLFADHPEEGIRRSRVYV